MKKILYLALLMSLIPLLQSCNDSNAATNTICEISGVKFTPKAIDGINNRAEFIHTEQDFLWRFEKAIDSLRRGDVYAYNRHAVSGEFATIKNNGPYLPLLNDNYTNDQLKAYEELANQQ